MVCGVQDAELKTGELKEFFSRRRRSFGSWLSKKKEIMSKDFFWPLLISSLLSLLDPLFLSRVLHLAGLCLRAALAAGSPPLFLARR